MSDINRKDLMAAGKELNALLEPQPKIKVVGVKTVDLEKSITKAGALIEDGDKLTEPTISVLTALGVELPEGMAPTAEEAPDESTEEPTEDINDDTDESIEAEEEVKGEEEEGGKEEAKDEDGATLQELYALAKDMNEVMGLDPAIGSRGKDKEELKVEIVNNCYDDDDNCEVYTTDELSDSSWVTLKQLNVKPIDPNDKTEPKKAGTKKKDEKPSVDEKVDKEAKVKAKKEVAAKAKAKQKKPSGEKSNKQIVYEAWKMDTEDAKELHKLIGERVQIGTIRGWIGSWKKGLNLPARAK